MFSSSGLQVRLRWPVLWQCSGCCFAQAKQTAVIPNGWCFAMTAERSGGAALPHVRIYLDNDPRPIVDRELPTDIALDTRSLTDGVHRMVIRAQGQNGREGVEEISFVVQNGPGISVSGLRPHSIRSGTVRFTVDAFSTDDPFDPRRAEARSAIPVWVWVMSLFVVSWAVWYAARMWEVPASYAKSPTYSHEAALQAPR
jgi:hypothetical protein